MKLDLAITGVGMLSAVGLDAAQCMHSVRCGISRMAVDTLQDGARQWIVTGRVPLWSPHPKAGHLQFLCGTALRQAWSMATGQAPLRRARLGLVLGAPDADRPGYRFPDPFRLEAWFRSHGLGQGCHLEVLPAGASSAQLALHRAAQLLQEGVVDAVLVGGADSQAQFRVVRWHESHMRLKCSYVTDGLMPAEAAAMLVVEPARAASSRGARVLARVLSVAASSDPGTVLSDQPLTAQALTRAVAAALTDSGVGAQDIGMVWSDLNGESARAREWAYCEIRNRFQDHTQLLHPADCQGDIGATTDAGLLALAAWSQACGWSAGAACMVASSSEGGVRAATVLAPGDAWPELKVSRGTPRPAASAGARDAPRPQGADPLRSHFEWEVREDHRDELASLHYQRLALQAGEDIAWQRVREPEQRMLNHLDAVCADGAPSTAAILEGAHAEEEGPCFAAAWLAGTLGRSEDLRPVVDALQNAPPARLQGVLHGLAHAPAGEALAQCLHALAGHADPALRRLAAEVAGMQLVDLGSAGHRLLADEDLRVASAAARAAMLVPSAAQGEPLQALVRRGAGQARRDAILALLLLDPRLTRAFCRRWLARDADFGGALSLCLGIAGQVDDAELLLQRAQQDAPDPHAVAALGILGVPSTVAPLLELRAAAPEAVRAAAGTALDLMCGEADPGCVPIPGARRMRRGRPHSARTCLQEIEQGTASAGERWRAGMELQLALGVHVPWHPGWFVARQEEAIARWSRLLAAAH